MILSVHIGKCGVLDDAQHQIGQDSRILHNVSPWTIVALRIRRNVAHIELDGSGATVELIVQP
jgi:hypothetical protein